MFSEYKYGNDRYMVKIWRKFHPEAKRVSREQLKFTFAEFARFLVNGSTEFSGDPYVIGHQVYAHFQKIKWKGQSNWLDFRHWQKSASLS